MFCSTFLATCLVSLLIHPPALTYLHRCLVTLVVDGQGLFLLINRSLHTSYRCRKRRSLRTGSQSGPVLHSISSRRLNTMKTCQLWWNRADAILPCGSTTRAGIWNKLYVELAGAHFRFLAKQPLSWSALRNTCLQNPGSHCSTWITWHVAHCYYVAPRVAHILCVGCVSNFHRTMESADMRGEEDVGGD
jgi:hypothetical protein